MGCLGALFAITEKEVATLRAFEDPEELASHIMEVIEERDLGGEWGIETDKAWDAIQRCFGAGLMDWKSGQYPLNYVILAGEPLYFEEDYVVSLKTPEQVADIAAAITTITKERLRELYNKIKPKKYGQELSEEDFDYTWTYFEPLIAFYQKAATAKRAVLFTVDQ